MREFARINPRLILPFDRIGYRIGIGSAQILLIIRGLIGVFGLQEGGDEF